MNSGATTATAPASSPSANPARAAAPNLAGDWDRRTQQGNSVTGAQGESLNVNFAADVARAALGSSSPVLAARKLDGSTEVRLDGNTAGISQIGAEQWGANTSRSKISNVEFDGTNFRGAVNYKSEYQNVVFNARTQLEAATFVECEFGGKSSLIGEGRVRSLRGSVVSVDSVVKLDLRGSDISDLKIRGTDGVAYTPKQLFDQLVATVGEAAALDTFRDMFRGTIYDRSTNMDPEFRAILDKVSAATKKAALSAFTDRKALFNELDNNPHFANDSIGADGSLSQRTRAADDSSFKLKLQDVDSSRHADVEVIAVRNATDTADLFKLKYNLSAGLDGGYLVARHHIPGDGSVLMTGADAFKAALQVVREIERQFQANGGPSRTIGGTPSTAAASPTSSGSTPSVTPPPPAPASPTGSSAAPSVTTPETPVAPTPSASVDPAAAPAPVAASLTVEHAKLVPSASAAANTADAVVAELRKSMTDFSLRNSEHAISPALRQIAEQHFSQLIDPTTGAVDLERLAPLRRYLMKETDGEVSAADGSKVAISRVQKTFFLEELGHARGIFGQTVEPDQFKDLDIWARNTRWQMEAFRPVGLKTEGEDALSQVVDEIAGTTPDGRIAALDASIEKVNEQLKKPDAELGTEGLSSGALMLLGRRLEELRDAELTIASAREVAPEAAPDGAAEPAVAAPVDMTSENEGKFQAAIASLGYGNHIDSLRDSVRPLIDFATGTVDRAGVDRVLDARMLAIDSDEQAFKALASSTTDVTYDPSTYSAEREVVGKLRVSLLGAGDGPNIFGVSA